MKIAKSFVCLAALIGVFAGLAVSAQKAAQIDLTGTWTGAAVINGGASKEEFTFVLERKDATYSGKFTTATGLATDAEIRNVVFKDGKLSFDFDLNGTPGSDVVTIEVTVVSDTMTGTWSSSSGEGDAIEAKKQK